MASAAPGRHRRPVLPSAAHNAGMMLLGSLIAGGAADDRVPPTRPVRVSISALARRFGVSRVHIIKLLDDAAADDLIARSQGEGNEITVLPRLAETLRDMLASMYLYFADCARQAQRRCRRPRPTLFS